MSRVGIFGQISEINDHLFLSGAGVITGEKARLKNITCIVNATTEEPSAHFQGVDYVRIRIEDHPYAHLDVHFDSVADKIKQIKDRGGRTLVHCVAGVSRSASLVIVYLIKYERMSLRQAYNYVKARRPVIRPNVGFWKMMCDYEKRVRGSTSVAMVMTNQCDMPLPDIYVAELGKRVTVREPRESAAALSSARPALSSMSSLSSSSSVPSGYGTYRRRGYSASSIRPTSTSLRSMSPLTPRLGLSTASHSLFSPAPSHRKQRDSLFSMYSPRRSFFSAF